MAMEDIIFSKIASTANCLKTISEFHQKIHDGNCYSNILSTTCAATSTVLYYIKAPNTTVAIHFCAVITSSIATLNAVFGNAAVAAASSYTVIPSYNRDFNSTKAATLICGMMPSSSGFSTYGGTIYEQYLNQTPVYIGASVIRDTGEWVLAKNGEYILRMVCLTTSAVVVNTYFYED